MNFADQFMLALCMWREARGDGEVGMRAVGCAIRNRVRRNKSTYYREITKALQFSSITDPNDSQLGLYPNPTDVAWLTAQSLAIGISMDAVEDVTHGSTMYYSPKSLTQKNVAAKPILIDGKERPFPRGWDASKVQYQMTAGSQLFFTEIG